MLDLEGHTTNRRLCLFLLDRKSRKAQKSDGCLLSHHPIYGIEIKRPFVRKTCDTTQLALAAERYSWGRGIMRYKMHEVWVSWRLFLHKSSDPQYSELAELGSLERRVILRSLPQSLELKTDSNKTADSNCMLQSQGHCIGFRWGETTGVTRTSYIFWQARPYLSSS